MFHLKEQKRQVKKLINKYGLNVIYVEEGGSYDIKTTLDNTEEGIKLKYVEELHVPKISNMCDYFVTLHEIGHAIHPCGIVKRRCIKSLQEYLRKHPVSGKELFRAVSHSLKVIMHTKIVEETWLQELCAWDWAFYNAILRDARDREDLRRYMAGCLSSYARDYYDLKEKKPPCYPDQAPHASYLTRHYGIARAFSPEEEQLLVS
jgi:hypothetical protein